MDISLKGKRALVTGANSGIGEAIALALGQAGAKVAINYLVHPEAAEDVVEKIKSAGSDAISVQADVTDTGAAGAMFTQIDKAWGGIDILVNNAGVDGKRAYGWEISPGDWLTVLKVNLFGAFNCAHQALKRMVPQSSGVIINLTSVHEYIAWSGYSAYTASKAGLSMLTKTLAQEAAPHGVRVMSLAPGAIKTPINKLVWDNAKSYADLLEKIPLGRIGEPSEVANMAVVLASDAASYVTGSTLLVDGAMTDYPGFEHGG
jgi:NAD(P)-dependent dehydrogenase (short-subunit alcohol dehydrogenase family)